MMYKKRIEMVIRDLRNYRGWDREDPENFEALVYQLEQSLLELDGKEFNREDLI